MKQVNEPIVESVLKLENIYVESFSFIRGEIVDNNNPTFAFGRNISKKNDNSSDVILQCKIEWNEKTKLDVSIKGIFSVVGDNKDVNHILLTRNSCAIMFPYLRSQITLLTSQLNFEPIVLPIININSLLDDLEKEEKLILSFLKGDFSLKNMIIEGYLQRVVEFAKKYKKRGIPLDEVIAEGNVGLMLAMQIVERNREEYILPEGRPDMVKFFGTLEMEVVHAMESYIDGMTESKDWENTMLAKTNLLHEAVKYMTEEIGRMPTLEELSEYTKIPEKEIKDISGLSKDAKKAFLS